MGTTVWVAQGVLSVVFLAAGSMKLLIPRETLEPRTPYVEDLTDTQVKAIGVLEVLGAVGEVLPAAIGIAPLLTPIAAACLALTMLAAATLLIRRGETSHVPLNVAMFLLAVFVAIERF